MPFFLYSVQHHADSSDYVQLNEIGLAGTSGPLCTFAANRNIDRKCPFRWHATEQDLLAILGKGENHSILIDLRPRDKDRVSLYRLCDVWGFSYEGWTPISLRLQSLFVETPQSVPAQFKLRFSDLRREHAYVAEFLYLLGGVCEGKWTWGMAGRVNGALLWKDAFEYLTAELSQLLA